MFRNWFSYNCNFQESFRDASANGYQTTGRGHTTVSTWWGFIQRALLMGLTCSWFDNCCCCLCGCLIGWRHTSRGSSCCCCFHSSCCCCCNRSRKSLAREDIFPKGIHSENESSGLDKEQTRLSNFHCLISINNFSNRWKRVARNFAATIGIRWATVNCRFHPCEESYEQHETTLG